MTTTASIHRSPLAAPPIEPAVAVAALRHAAGDPTAVAVIDGATGETVTRGELAARSAAIAAGLRERGIGRGDLVAIAMPNFAWWPVVAMGVWRTGAAIEPLSPLWTADESARVLQRAMPSLAVAFAPVAPAVGEALRAAAPDVQLVVAGGDAPLEEQLAGDPGDPYAEPDLSPTDLAAVPFSSGTGGLPKGVRLTHGNLAAGAAQAIVTLSTGGPLDADAVVLAAAPFFHSIGLTLLLCGGLVAGATIVTVPIPKLDAIVPLAAAHGVTHMAIPPPVFEAMATSALLDEHDLSSIRSLVTGGAHVTPGVEDGLSDRLGCMARSGYGMTECTCTISAPLGRMSTAGTVGWLVPGTEARLIDPETGADADGDEPGELWVRGPQVMEGYHGLPEETAACVTPDGWLRTGDLVQIRADGQLEIRDRFKELIKVSGASVAPAEIELVLREHPAVSDAGVIGVPDSTRGEAPMAFVALAAPAEPDELAQFAAARLAGYKHPREVVVVDDLPRSPTGKLLRGALRERAAMAARA
ncbi:MAG TPA: AMP-binding protein [Solirubrobacteraceae bacterium]